MTSPDAADGARTDSGRGGDEVALKSVDTIPLGTPAAAGADGGPTTGITRERVESSPEASRSSSIPGSDQEPHRDSEVHRDRAPGHCPGRRFAGCRARSAAARERGGGRQEARETDERAGRVLSRSPENHHGGGGGEEQRKRSQGDRLLVERDGARSVVRPK